MVDLQQVSPIKLWRKGKLYLLGPALLGLLGGLLVFHLLTPLYRARTTIMVEQQQVPDNYVASTVSTSVAKRLETIEQQVRSRGPLEQTIEELELYPDLREELPMEKLVERARDSLSIRVVRGTVFSIMFSDPDPELAAAAANRIASLFIRENLRLRESQAQNASAFLETETEDLRVLVEEQADKIAAFKRRHEGRLPQQKGLILNTLTRLERQLEINRESLQAAELKRMLLASGAALGTELEEDVSSRSWRQAELNRLRQKRSEMLARYSEKHPDVLRLQREIDMLVEQLEAERAREKDALAARLAEEEATVELDPGQSLELQQVGSEIERLKLERDKILERMMEFESRLEAIPRLQQELRALENDYENLQNTYRVLQSKHLNAQLAEDLERSQQAEQFRVLDRALPPLDPYAPRAWLVVGSGLLIGLFLGLGAAVLVLEVDTTFADAEALQEAFPGVRITASIPRIRPSEDVATKPGESRRRKTA